MVASIGIFTAILAAAIALTQNDIKKVLAYSTVCQLGIHVLRRWASAPGRPAIFHLVTHAFFKACCSSAPARMHGTGASRTCATWAACGSAMPWTYWTMVVGSLALAGIPIFAGFFSKDEILGVDYNHGWLRSVYPVGVLIAF